MTFASYIFSISAGSAGIEREFARMGYLLSSRRSRHTPSHTNKRLTLANLIPQEKRLERLLTVRITQKIRLFKNLSAVNIFSFIKLCWVANIYN